ncbi:AraC family transcriptional regulator [Rubellicoccus peritrichatus]|uniref:AraC family transcriptional regulator n=1 Tax=Rubellicoccus peritrichatus TaxID=3080537 RepID=A0AAQ3L9G6_9BACT|nr:AraC family transcriptional regulator [Puniceicoccus sp. CR14]WOO41556.1 AraC family transcriptional regulator [Puniceicoccus sp. CR14]
MRIFPHFGHWRSGKVRQPLLPHKDPGLELVYLANGEVSWDYDGAEVMVPAGHLSFSWPWEIHGANDIRLPSVELYWLLIPLWGRLSPNSRSMKLMPELGLSIEEASAVTTWLKGHESHVLKTNSEFRKCFPLLIKALQLNDGNYDLRARGLFFLSMAELLKSTQVSRKNDGESAKLARVQTYWEETVIQKLDAHLPLEEMASSCDMGRTCFTELTKKLFGGSPVRVLTRKRTDLAKHLLAESDASITEIAFQCGFNSSQHFATVFKAYTEMTPSDYRRQLD